MSQLSNVRCIQAETSKNKTDVEDSSVQHWRHDDQSQDRSQDRTQRSLVDRLQSEFNVNLDVSDNTETEEGELTDDENVPDPNASKMDTETPTLDEENPDDRSISYSERPIMGKYMFSFLI